MKSKPGLALFLMFVASNGFAIEADPVSKARLAIGEANLVLRLIEQQTNEDSKLDMMCLRLGRFSAILKRIRGSVPLPPVAVTEKYIHYESFCGWGLSDVIPRGASHPTASLQLRDNLVVDSAVLQQYVNTNTK